MRSNPQEPTDLVTFTKEFLNGKLHFPVCSVGPNRLYTIHKHKTNSYICDVSSRNTFKVIGSSPFKKREPK